MKSQITRLILPFTIIISGGFVNAASIDALVGEYQVVERSCQETDRWCAMIDQISFAGPSESARMVTLSEIGSNKNVLANHLVIENFEARNQMGQGIRETFIDTNPDELVWESLRFARNSETGLDEDVYKETFKLLVKDEFVQLEFSNEHIKVQGQNRSRIFKLVRIK